MDLQEARKNFCLFITNMFVGSACQLGPNQNNNKAYFFNNLYLQFILFVEIYTIDYMYGLCSTFLF